MLTCDGHLSSEHPYRLLSNNLTIPENFPVEWSESPESNRAPWDDLFHIEQCMKRLLALGVRIEKEHAELGDDGHVVWRVRCRRGAEQFVGEGGSPLESWRQAVARATAS
jgi:hypothetical protein